MTSAGNVIPFLRDPSKEEDFDDGGSILLGKIKREEWELWVCLHKNGSVSLKWWTWRDDLQSFYPKADFEEIDLTPSELGPLGELLIAAGKDPILGKEWPL